MSPLNIFICYKKVLTREREGKVIEQRDSKADILHFLLSRDQEYVPWMDEAELGAGMAWEAEIYRKILISDVLLLLIGSGTSKSQWVQREIALANALGISVVPLGSDINWVEMETELKALGIEHFQGKVTHNIKLNAGDALLSELRVDLLSAAERTKKQQEETLRGLLTRRTVRSPKAPDNKSAATFDLRCGNASIRVHVASGDIAKVRDVDAFVNSENDYMQMARFFESKTVSATLRQMGARIRDGKYDDTIQHELDFQLRDRGRPVQYAEVFATSAGGPSSILARENRARYILHVAAVQAVPAEGRVIPFKQPSQIERCVREVLSKIAELNKARGIVSPPGSEQRIEQETRAQAGDDTIRSVLFPLFGTGQAGSPPSEVLGPMLDGIDGFFDDSAGLVLSQCLKDVYLSAYTVYDVQETIALLKFRPNITL
jgi:O-acetyl-ADP-ribose deacetylase (regulator of RNase III)